MAYFCYRVNRLVAFAAEWAQPFSQHSIKLSCLLSLRNNKAGKQRLYSGGNTLLQRVTFVEQRMLHDVRTVHASLALAHFCYRVNHLVVFATERAQPFLQHSIKLSSLLSLRNNKVGIEEQTQARIMIQYLRSPIGVIHTLLRPLRTPFSSARLLFNKVVSLRKATIRHK